MRKSFTFKRKAFTIIELIAGFAMVAILSTILGSLLYYHAFIIKQLTQRQERCLEYQYALDHLLSNINGSAWIVVKDNNTIELHSHRYPKLRFYNFKNNILTYYESDSSSLPQEGGTIIAKNIDATQFFKAEGTSRPNGRFHEVSISFWEMAESSKDYLNSDKFSALVSASCKEPRDLLYVDPDHAQGYEDGTKHYPFRTVESAAATSSELPVADRIVVVSGAHTFSEDITIPCAYLGFDLGSSLTIDGPNTTVKFNMMSTLYMRGDFYIGANASPGQKITLVSAVTEAERQAREADGNLWRWFFLLETMQPELNLVNMDVSDAESAFQIGSFTDFSTPAAYVPYFQTINLMNNRIASCGVPFFALTTKALYAVNNYFINSDYCDICCYENSDYKLPAGLPTAEPFLRSISNNSFDNSDYGIKRLGGYLKENNLTFGYKIHHNNFSNGIASILFDSYTDYTNFPERSIEIYQNAIASKGQAISIGDSCIDAVPGGALSIHNNTITSLPSLNNNYVAGIIINENQPYTLSNNLISNEPAGIYITNYKTKDPLVVGIYEIKNNILNNNPKQIDMVTSNTQTVIKNNIVYGGGIYARKLSSGSVSEMIRFTNNTTLGSSLRKTAQTFPNTEIKDCIMWDAGTSIEAPKEAISYSDIYGMAPDPLKYIYSEDPKFQHATNPDLLKRAELNPSSLFSKANSPDKIEWGAFGGDPSDIAAWNNGVGVTEPVGPQL